MTDQPRIRLFQPKPAFGVPNPSPFCIKLETWLRIAGLDYEAVPWPDPRKAPKGKIPFVELDGERVGDSEIIIAKLVERCGVDPDKGLSKADKAVARAFARLLENHLYWIGVYSRWLEDAPFAVVREAFFGGLPPVVRQVLPPLVRRSVRRTLHEVGLGRHAPAEVYKMAEDDLRALSEFLGKKAYLMGDAPRTVDAWAYGVLTSIVDAGIDTPLRPIGQRYKSLAAYTKRMREAYFAELGAVAAA